MAEIKAFKALRFTDKAGNIKDNICPPYDIISEEERRALIEKSENNVIRLELPKGDNPYAQASDVLNSWLEKGILACDKEDSLYVYEEQFECEGKRYKIHGLICLVRLEEFSKGIVLPHEETLSKAKEDRFNLMSATFCNFSQVYSMYVDEDRKIASEIDKILDKKPEVVTTTPDGICHSLWAETDKSVIESIVKGFDGKQLYIADGHHRYETALNFRNHMREEGLIGKGDENGNYVMMFLADIDDDGLVILPTHRMVKDIENYNEKEVLAQIEKDFDVEWIDTLDGMMKRLDESKNRAYAYYTGKNGYYLCTLRDESKTRKMHPDRSPAYAELDVTGLHTHILEPVFKIDKENMASQKNLVYTRSLEEAIDKVRCGEFQCSFILRSTKMRQIKDVACAGDKMPQKSTYFYPKLITGLVMNKFR